MISITELDLWVLCFLLLIVHSMVTPNPAYRHTELFCGLNKETQQNDPKSRNNTFHENDAPIEMKVYTFNFKYL